jgi:hypothetical protein
MPTVLTKDCLGVVFDFLGAPSLETVIANQIKTTVSLGAKQDKAFVVKHANESESFTVRIKSDLWPGTSNPRKLVVVVLRKGMGPYECTFHRRRVGGYNPHIQCYFFPRNNTITEYIPVGVGVAAEIIDRYADQGQFELAIFDHPDMMARFKARKTAFLASLE